MAGTTERRLLVTPGLRLRKRPTGRRGRRAEGDDEEEDKPAAKDDDKEKDQADDEPEEKEDEEQEEEQKEDEQDEKADPDSPGTIEGYAAVFHSEQEPGTEYELYSAPGFRALERIARGAFSRAIQEEDDVRALVNHEPDQLIGRTGAGTCRLVEDERGLRYSVDLPDTTVGRDAAVMIGRGDMTGSSFGFVVEQESWRESELPDGSREAVRTVEAVRLLDVGPVTYPAYAATSAGRQGDEEDDTEAKADGADAEGEEKDDQEEEAPVRAVGSVAEAVRSYERWKATQRSAGTGTDLRNLPLAAKLAQVRARAVQVGQG